MANAIAYKLKDFSKLYCIVVKCELQHTPPNSHISYRCPSCVCHLNQGASCTAVNLKQCLNGCWMESKIYVQSGVYKYEIF